jgi:putative cell wall-binding protein
MFTAVMTRRRAPAATRIAMAMVAALALSTPPAVAHHPAGTQFKSGPVHEFGEMVDYPLVFPVDGPHWFDDWFWAPRGGGSIHHGQDIMADKMTPVVAAASGTIKYVNWSSNPNNIDPARCCTLVIDHDDGWQSWYLHLNNDTPGTDDGLGWGIVDGILPGVWVAAGQHIGWVGDSGNAEDTDPHLHFELIDPHGVIVNPYMSLVNAIDASVAPKVKAASQTAECGGLIECLPDAGTNRRVAAADVARLTHPDGADTVYLVLDRFSPTALAVAPAAAHADAPVLLVAGDRVPPPTQRQLLRLGPDRVFVAATRAEVSDAALDDLRSLLPAADVTRLGGRNRLAAAANVTQSAFGTGVSTVYVSNGQAFPNAAAAAHIATANDAPLLLVRPDRIPARVQRALTELRPARIVVIGDAVTEAAAAELRDYDFHVSRIAADNRFALSAQIALTDFAASETVYVAVGRNYPNAVVASPVVRSRPGPVLFISRDSIDPFVAAELSRLAPSRIVLLSRPDRVSHTVIQQLAAYIH